MKRELPVWRWCLLAWVVARGPGTSRLASSTRLAGGTPEECSGIPLSDTDTWKDPWLRSWTESRPPLGADPNHWPVPSESWISKTSVPPLGPGTAPEELFDRKKRADEASEVHIATDTVSWGDGGRPRRDVWAENESRELRERVCWACACTAKGNARERRKSMAHSPDSTRVIT